MFTDVLLGILACSEKTTPFTSLYSSYLDNSLLPEGASFLGAQLFLSIGTPEEWFLGVANVPILRGFYWSYLGPGLLFYVLLWLLVFFVYRKRYLERPISVPWMASRKSALVATGVVACVLLVHVLVLWFLFRAPAIGAACGGGEATLEMLAEKDSVS